MQGAAINADNITYRTYLQFYNTKNPIDGDISGIVWSNGTCPPQNLKQGQMVWDTQVRITPVVWQAICRALELI